MIAALASLLAMRFPNFGICKLVTLSKISGVSRFFQRSFATVPFAYGKRFTLTMPNTSHLNTVVISNFKSFRGETIIGPLQPFTAIIGPNGSGKSNIVDAVSFALGEKPSALRVKRLDELVYRGSVERQTKESSTYVKVVLTIDGTKDAKSFTRKIRGETSQYKIDEKIVTNTIYMTELREMGLDIKAGNFLIPQGYIECFAMKTPKELTAMFEEISNSNAYKAEYERLKLELLKATEEEYFGYKMKRQLFMQKKNATMEKAETERYLQLDKQYNKTKLKFQSIRLLLIKKGVKSMIDEKIEIKSQINEYLRDKKSAIFLLERTKSEFKSLSSSLEAAEQYILKMENVIQKRTVEYGVFEENISHWQKKHDFACVSLDSANKARDTNKRIVQELRDELKQIDNKLTELREASQESNIELSNVQVKCYMELMIEVECRAKDLVTQINSLMRDQQADQDKLDNENRYKQELEDKVKQMTLRRDDLETQLKKLQDNETKTTLMEKTAKIKEQRQKVTEIQNISLSLENNIAKISEELSQADIDNNIVSRMIKKKDTIKMLKQFNSGVYGRISDLCKPVHSRYNVAITKVFGKNMDAIVVDSMRTAKQSVLFLKDQKIGVETFLPLDSIKTTVLKEYFRAITEPRNVKLLYDLLNISSTHSTQIDKAVLFIVKNTLVCETAEDARRMAYETHNDCVSLDGCFYRKDGIISGGQADLIVKAKQWGEQQVLTLKEQKAQLLKKLRDLPKVSLIQPGIDINDVHIKGLTLRNKYIESDIETTKDKIVTICEELDKLNRELLEQNMTIFEIQDDMQKRDRQVKSMEKYVNAIKYEIFVDFCKDINVPDISYYEKNNLRTYQERKKRQVELEEQYDRIENQLHFENEKDTESKVLKWKRAMERADAELNTARREEPDAKIKVKQAKTEMSKLKDDYASVKKNLERVEKKLAEHKSQIGVMEKSYLEGQKAYIAVQKKIEQKKIECNTILKDCKIEDIIIPMLETSHRRSEESTFTSSNSNIESSDGWEVLEKIDYSQFPKDILKCTEEDLQDMAKQSNEKLMMIQNELKNIVNPNLKVDEKIDLIAQQTKEIHENFRKYRDKFNEIKMQFETVKTKRCKLFSDCLDRVAAEIDSIYKNLVNDTSAQAIILSDNPEEPYAGNIIYNCLAPSKGFHPLQYLSGGEKLLASLALIFAIQRYKQSPFLIMDEGDAALDKANIKNFIRFISSQTNNMQFITISHNKQLYCNADALIGVSTRRNEECPHSEIFAISLNGYR